MHKADRPTSTQLGKNKRRLNTLRLRLRELGRLCIHTNSARDNAKFWGYRRQCGVTVSVWQPAVLCVVVSAERSSVPLITACRRHKIYVECVNYQPSGGPQPSRSTRHSVPGCYHSLQNVEGRDGK
ncbi:hypothetical protein RRG08_000589 [Elysia crispata]|uniref:Uncharacterized protein n=1 Tax=Elysia crispata TaxID=231223 RepID=A0AAE1CU69_9GAST|nr:hypothetical protein RRG08_000589 [Elysia crispata]